MNKTLATIWLMLISWAVFAQPPQGFNYQSVVLDTADIIMKDAETGSCYRLQIVNGVFDRGIGGISLI